MIKYFAPLIRSFLKLILLRSGYRFEKALETPRQTQEKVFKNLLSLFNNSQYGHQFGKVSSYSEFTQKVPIIEYEDIEPEIKKMKAAGENYFSPSPVIFYEPTSGSSGPKKLIPYTWALKSAFSKMFSLWAWDLLNNGPRFNRGKFYFSVSPQFKDVGEGLEDDTDYLEGFFSWFLKPFFITPKKIKKIVDPLHFKKVLALHLLAEEDLEIISVWNPSTFTVLLDFIHENKVELILELEKGMTSYEGITFKFKKPSEERKEVLKNSSFSEIWPHLKLISSWGSMEAQLGLNKLKKYFPETMIQSKGLLATEAPMTIPLIKPQAFTPLLQTIFYEFQDQTGQIHRLSELTGGETYKIIISTPGGLYRYKLGDKVKVNKFYKETPCLEFIGRGKETSDLFGEKLNIKFLKDIVERLSGDNYYLFYPNRIDEDQGFYTLLTDNNDPALEKSVEDELMKGFHYQVARKLGTLKPLKVIYRKDMNQRVLSYFQNARGMKLGDIKPSLLLHDFDSDYLS